MTLFLCATIILVNVKRFTEIYAFQLYKINNDWLPCVGESHQDELDGGVAVGPQGAGATERDDHAGD